MISNLVNFLKYITTSNNYNEVKFSNQLRNSTI